MHYHGDKQLKETRAVFIQGMLEEVRQAASEDFFLAGNHDYLLKKIKELEITAGFYGYNDVLDACKTARKMLPSPQERPPFQAMQTPQDNLKTNRTDHERRGVDLTQYKRRRNEALIALAAPYWEAEHVNPDAVKKQLESIDLYLNDAELSDVLKGKTVNYTSRLIKYKNNCISISFDFGEGAPRLADFLATKIIEAKLGKMIPIMRSYYLNMFGNPTELANSFIENNDQLLKALELSKDTSMCFQAIRNLSIYKPFGEAIKEINELLGI